jgi:protein gp37
MADRSPIEWTDATWNPVRGCTRVSEGCRHCYAEGVAARFSGPGQAYEGLADRSRPGSKWTGKVILVDHLLTLPLTWRKSRRIFVNSMSDLFHEALGDDQIDRVFAVMALARQHTLQVLTKRPDRMRDYLSNPMVLARIARAIARVTAKGTLAQMALGREIVAGFETGETWPLRNVWLGVSVEDQKAADERIPYLLAMPAALRFLSCEPLLGPLDLTRVGYGVHDDFKDCGGHPDPHFPVDSVGIGYTDALRGEYWGGTRIPDGSEPKEGWERGYTLPRLDWVIAGGESGPGARPMHPDWIRSLRDQCQAAGVPFFFKQWGEWIHESQAYFPPAFHPEFRDGEPTGPRWHFWTNDRSISDASFRVGKKVAGRELDGRTWNEFPAGMQVVEAAHG